MDSWIYDDGGRAESGYSGTADDCACRAIAIATHLTYQGAYDLINTQSQREYPGSKRRAGRRSSARTGVFKATMKRVMEEVLGWEWVPCMGVGTGCQVHVKADELPRTGAIILRLSKHYAAWVDGELRDTHDSSRNGTRCVYGYWKPKTVRGE